MADDVSAGRLHLDAYADTSGFARDARAKIDAAVKNLRAKIKTELDDRGLITQARESAKKAQEAAKVRLQAEVDSRGLVAQIKRAASDASKEAQAKVKIGAQIDTAKFQRDLAASVAAMNNRYSVSVNVDLDTAAAEARLAAFRAGQKNLPLDLGVNINTGNLAQTISQFSMLPAIAGGVYLLVGLVGQLAGGLFAVASSAAQAVTTLAALPGLVGALAQGIGVLFAGFSGIGDAVAALGKADMASAQQTQKAASIRTDSARAVADAQQRLKDAYHQAADAARQSGYAVADAEWNLARAQEAAKAAQEGVNQARKDAKDRIDELNDSLDRAVLTEEEAANNLAKAKQALQDVMWDKSASAQEQKDAALAVKQAQQDYADAKDQRSDLAKETKKANEEGVSGSQEVEQAKDQLRDANHSLMLAERQLFEARHSAADTARQNAQNIAAAQQAIKDAQSGGTEAIQAQNVALAQQMSAYDKLSPTAQKFARFLFDTVMPRFRTLRDNVQEALLPPLQEGIEASMPLIDTLEKGLIGTAGVVGRLAKRVGNLFGSEGFNRDTATIMDSNNRALRLFGRAGINIIKILKDIAVVAGPTLVEPFAKWVVQLTRGWRQSIKTARETGTLADRFVKARKTAKLLWDILGNVAGAIHGLGTAATPAGDDMLRSLRKTTQGWEDWTKSTEGQNRLREYFNQTKPAMKAVGDLLGEFAKSIALMGESGGGPLVGALKAITGLFRGLNKVLATPYLGTAVGWLMTLAGAAGGLGLVAGQVVKLGQGIGLLAKVTGLTKAWQMFNNTLIANRIGLAALAAKQRAVAIGQRVWNGVMAAGTIIMRGMRAAANLMFGPWGIAILAIAALFVLLYKKVDWFRAAVDWVAGKIVDAFHWLVDGAKALWDEWFGHSVFPDIVDGLRAFWGVVKKVFGFIVDAIKVLADVAVWLYEHAFKPAWSFISKAISIAWNYYYKPILKLWWAAIKLAGAVVMWLWKNAVVPAWGAIQKAIAVAWPVVKRIFGLFRTGLHALGDVFGWLWKNIVQPVWRGIEKIIRLAWAGIKVYFKALRIYLRVLGAIFEWLWKHVVQPVWKGIRVAIGVAWDLIKGYFSLLRKGLNAVGDVMSWLWHKVVKPVWDGIQKSINTVWGFLRDKVFDPLIDLVKNDIPDAFEKAKNGIKTIWDKLKGIAAAPVRFVVNTVYSDGIRKVVNAIPGVPDLDPITFNYARGTSSVLPGYTPGRDVHNFRSADGRMALNLSGGEGIVRPEVVRALGPKTIDFMNAAARRGGNALRNLLIPGSDQQGYKNGGILGGIRKTMSFFLGGVMPLRNASVSAHSLPYYNTGATWAGDLNYPGYADYGKPIVAWKSGIARPFDLGRDDSYGRGQVIDSGGQSALYAHMSRVITSLAGQVVRAGQTIGYVGDYGNTGNPPTSHLHFEVRGGSINLADMGGGGTSAAEAKGQQEKSSWMSAIGAIKDVVTTIPSKVNELAHMDGWGPLMRQAVGSFGTDLIQWVNDKIPDSISIPGPNIPLPDNPIPNPFKLDRGGDWHTGTMGVNLSGQTETVFTNENIVDLTENLARIANGLRGQTVDSGSGGGGGAGVHIDHLALTAAPEKVQQVLGDLHHSLRLLSLGGVHAKRAAGASV